MQRAVVFLFVALGSCFLFGVKNQGEAAIPLQVAHVLSVDSNASGDVYTLVAEIPCWRRNAVRSLKTYLPDQVVIAIVFDAFQRDPNKPICMALPEERTFSFQVSPDDKVLVLGFQGEEDLGGPGK